MHRLIVDFFMPCNVHALSLNYGLFWPFKYTVFIIRSYIGKNISRKVKKKCSMQCCSFARSTWACSIPPILLQPAFSLSMVHMQAYCYHCTHTWCERNGIECSLHILGFL